jgi:propanol-preferring alcohol dehydrogenase
MFAMVHTPPGRLLCEETRPDPLPGPGEVRLRVRACGVCRTDLHVIDQELAPRLPSVIRGHEVVGVVDALGEGVTGLTLGQRLGAAWLAGACGRCPWCLASEENLCDAPDFNGWTRDGGYADTLIARADFCFPLPDGLSDIEAAPLMCAGLIGYRSWRKACEGRPVARLGLYGFGAAAHLLAQLAIWSGQQVHAFTRPGDAAAQDLARGLGCAWAGGSDQLPPEPLDAAIIFAPAGDLVPAALKAVCKGGIVVCGGIHMSDIPSFPYALLWEERRLVSVANLTRRDAREYLPLAAQAGVRPQVTTYRLDQANTALQDLRDGAFAGAAVLVV